MTQMETVVISAAVGAGVSWIASTLLHWGSRIVAFARSKVARDHRSLHAGEWPLVNQGSSTAEVWVLVACAPSRSLRRKEIEPDKAIRFLRQSFPQLAECAPAFSSPKTGVRLGEPRDQGAGYAWAWAAGRIDRSTSIALEVRGESSKAVLPLLEVVHPVLEVYRAVRGSDYRQVFGGIRIPGAARRFDWYIGVTPRIILDGSSEHWGGVSFPGRRPSRAADQFSFCPPGGFAASALKNWNPRRSPRELLEVFLNDFLKSNGFHDCDAAIADTIKVVPNTAPLPSGKQEVHDLASTRTTAGR